MNLCVFVTYDRLNRSTNRHEILEAYLRPSRDGHYDIYFLKNEKQDFFEKIRFFARNKKKSIE